MPDDTLRLRFDDPIAVLELRNASRHNALGSRDIRRCLDLLKQLDGIPDVRVLVVANPEGGTFCAGAALDELAAGQLTSNEFARLPEKIAALKFPTIAAVNGNAYGGGAEIALACDFRVGTATMKTHLPPARIGLCYPLSGIERLVSRLGVTAAKRLLLANEVLDGEELFRLGFLTHLADSTDVNSEALSLARQIVELAPLAVSAMKSICDDMAKPVFDPEEARKLETLCHQSRDFREGLSAVLEKRPPLFRGE